MAGSTLDTEVIKSRFKIKNYDHDPGGTSATVLSPDGGTTKYIQDMRDFFNILYQSTTSVSASSSGVTKLEIVAYEDSAGAGTAYSQPISGVLQSIVYTKTDFANGGTITVTSSHSGATL